MRVVDNAVLAHLATLTPLAPVVGEYSGDLEARVHDGYVTPDDKEGKVISKALPYVVYLSNVGDDINRRLAGYNSRRSVFFATTYVGDSREQCKVAGEAVYAALADKRIPGMPANSGRIQLDTSDRIRRDDDAARPDGTPLFYGVTTWSVALARGSNQ
jgi:hypothetical protein